MGSHLVPKNGVTNINYDMTPKMGSLFDPKNGVKNLAQESGISGPFVGTPARSGLPLRGGWSAQGLWPPSWHDPPAGPKDACVYFRHETNICRTSSHNLCGSFFGPSVNLGAYSRALRRSLSKILGPACRRSLLNGGCTCHCQARGPIPKTTWKCQVALRVASRCHAKWGRFLTPFLGTRFQKNH